MKNDPYIEMMPKIAGSAEAKTERCFTDFEAFSDRAIECQRTMGNNYRVYVHCPDATEYERRKLDEAGFERPFKD